MEALIAKRYVKALAQTSPSLEEDASILSALSQALQEGEVKRFLSSPLVDENKKASLLLELLKEAPKHLQNLIRVLAQHKRLTLIPAIYETLASRLQEQRGVYEGVVQSNETLSQETVKKLEESLKRYTGATVTLRQEEGGPDGLKVTVEDLGVEVNFSKERVKAQLIDFIERSL